MTQTNEERKDYIAALLREKEGYERQEGKEEQIQAVDAELKRVGYEAKAPSKRAATR